MLIKMVQPGYFTAWITCLTKEYEDKIVAGMIKKEYTVGLANAKSGLSVSSPNSVATVISFIVFSPKENIEATKVYEDLVAILTEHKIYFYSAIVSAMVDSSWCCGNMVLPSDKDNTTPQIPTPTPGKNLN